MNMSLARKHVRDPLANFHILKVSAAWLVVLLQRTPILRVGNVAAELIGQSRIGALVRSTAVTVASLGAVHSLAGATQFVVSNQNVSAPSARRLRRSHLR